MLTITPVAFMLFKPTLQNQASRPGQFSFSQEKVQSNTRSAILAHHFDSAL
jgi:hypothetical protein